MSEITAGGVWVAKKKATPWVERGGSCVNLMGGKGEYIWYTYAWPIKALSFMLYYRIEGFYQIHK